jgi:NDP-sugar pyrophosphorylase family protein
MSELNLNWLEENFKNKEIVVFDIGSANLHDTVRIKQVLPDAKFYSFECNKVWEKGPLETLAKSGQLKAFKHYGFWQPMDTLRDKQLLEDLWASGNTPWKMW